MLRLANRWEKLRRSILPRLGIVVQLLEDVTGVPLYVRSGTHTSQFVGRVPYSEPEFESELQEMGFERNPLAALKRLRRTNEVEEGSFRYVEDDRDKQLHVVIYDGEPMANAATGVTYVYAHWEYRWDTDPLKHYRGIDVNEAEGVQRMEKHLNEHGIPYDNIRP